MSEEKEFVYRIPEDDEKEARIVFAEMVAHYNDEHPNEMIVLFDERSPFKFGQIIRDKDGKAKPVRLTREELEDALWAASEQGKYPVLCDQSPCLHRMRHCIRQMKLYEPAEFISTFLAPRLKFKPTDRPVAVHVTCSMRLMELADTIIGLAKKCSTNVVVPEGVGCCGFAGDRGFTHPEVNEYALRKLKPQLEAANIQIGYSNSRTCEIGLETNTGVPYVSIAYLVDECTEAI